MGREEGREGERNGGEQKVRREGGMLVGRLVGR